MYIMMWSTSHIPMRVVYQMYHTLYFSISTLWKWWNTLLICIIMLSYVYYCWCGLNKGQIWWNSLFSVPFASFTCCYICIFVLFTCSIHSSTEQLLHIYIDIWSCRPWEDPYSSLDIIHASTSCQTLTHFKLFISICPITKSVDNPAQFISLLRKT